MDTPSPQPLAIYEPALARTEDDDEIERSLRDLDMKIAMLRREASELSNERDRRRRPKT